MDNKVVLGLGGNLGNVEETLATCRELIGIEIGEILTHSSLYRTAAWGVENQPDFLNQVLLLETSMSPLEVLRTCLRIEKELGRNRAGVDKWHARVVDIDLLFFNNISHQDEELTLPHPHLHERNFVLFPMAEIMPDFEHPTLKKSIQDLKIECNDSLGISKI